MKKKIIISVVIIILGFFLINKYYVKNIWCKSENGWYEVWGRTPIDMTVPINNGECECISESLIIEKKPNHFNRAQLEKIKNELPNWAVNNIKGFSEKDKKDLFLKLKQFTDKEFLQKLEYKYTFIEDTYLTCFIPVFVFSIGSEKAYCPNYQCVYDGYKKLINNPEGTKFGSKKKQPNYPIIESVAWARKFGDKGI